MSDDPENNDTGLDKPRTTVTIERVETRLISGDEPASDDHDRSEDQNGGETQPSAIVLPTNLPLLPLRDIVVFPDMAASLLVGRPESIEATNAALTEQRLIGLFTQRDPDCETPTADDLYPFGVTARILQYLKMPDGAIKILIEGIERTHLQSIIAASSDPEINYRRVEIEYAPSIYADQEEANLAQGLLSRVLEKFESYTEMNSKISDQFPENMLENKEPDQIADFIAQILPANIENKHRLLASTRVAERLSILLEIIESELSIQMVERKIRGRVKSQMEKSQKEFYLSEQIKAIKQELGEDEDTRSELEELEGRIKATSFPREVREKAQTELKRLKNMSPVSAEATVIRNYLDWLLDVPWKKRSKLKNDIAAAEKTLKKDHYGLHKVRERVLEHLAVQARSKDVRGSILCFVGPPGVGKTSLGRSIASATGREFVRMSLGGVRDESEIRGHRRTYIGAMPGRIIQAMKKAKMLNPLILLDEVDKLGSDWRGDPSSALLEVLDPEQNANFNDHYLEVDYDLSKVLFVTTANSLNIPGPLRDRMEIIRLDGYTEDEKVQIARRHLIPKITKDSALKNHEWHISPQVLIDIIRHYTRESGVRGLERSLRSLARKAVKILMQSKNRKQVKFTTQNLGKYLGPRKYRFTSKGSENQVGLVNGLAWSEVGGDVLHIEAVAYPGDGKVSKTGKLGDVMKESIEAAEHYLKSRAENFGISREKLKATSIHLHVPEGATPKDGPSAGVAMAMSMISVLTGIPIVNEVAMTGEITLRGKVLEIGGLKLKLLAAARGGIRKVLIPEDNVKDLEDIPQSILKTLEIVPIGSLKDALPHVLERAPEPIPVEPAPATPAEQASSEKNDNDPAPISH